MGNGNGGDDDYEHDYYYDYSDRNKNIETKGKMNNLKEERKDDEIKKKRLR